MYTNQSCTWVFDPVLHVHQFNVKLFYLFYLSETRLIFHLNRPARISHAVFSMLSIGLIIFSRGTGSPFVLHTFRSTGKGGLRYRMSSCFATSKQYVVNLALLSRIVVMFCHGSRCCTTALYWINPRSTEMELALNPTKANHSRGRDFTWVSTADWNIWIFW